MLHTLMSAAAEVAEPTIGTTVLLGFGTVFVGLLCLILLVTVMGAVIRGFTGKKQQKAVASDAAATVAPAAGLSAAERRQLIAAVSCALATVMGRDVTGIRIVSFKKVN